MLQKAPKTKEAGETAATPAPSRKKLVLRALAGLVLLAILYFGGSWILNGRFLISTEDAFLQSDFSALAARVPGTVAEVPVAENSIVKQGDVLVRLDAGDYRLALNESGFRVETQKAALARIHEQARAQEANITAASAALTREEAAFSRAASLDEQQFASAKALDEARAARDSAKANLAAAEAGRRVIEAEALEAEAKLHELEAAKEKATRDLAFTEIRAPFDGITGNRAVEPGQFVQAGSRLMALVPIGNGYVEANFKETQLARIKPGQKATIEIDAFGSEIEGEVESIAPASGAQFSLLPPENATGNFTKIVQRVPVRIRITDAHGLTLRPGLSVTAIIDTRLP